MILCMCVSEREKETEEEREGDVYMSKPIFRLMVA